MTPNVFPNSRSRRHNRGAALVVGLVLLMVITLLAISSMSTSTLELQMAGNMQFAQRAEHAAQIGIESGLSRISYGMASVVINPTPVAAGSADSFSGTIQPVPWPAGVTDIPAPPAGPGPAPGAGVGGGSIGEGVGLKAQHFDIQITGTSARNATISEQQSFYFQVPGS